MYKGKVTEEHYRWHNLVRNLFRNVIIHIRDEKYPMFAGRRIRFNQLMSASKIYYHKRSHTDWDA